MDAGRKRKKSIEISDRLNKCGKCSPFVLSMKQVTQTLETISRYENREIIFSGSFHEGVPDRDSDIDTCTCTAIAFVSDKNIQNLEEYEFMELDEILFRNKNVFMMKETKTPGFVNIYHPLLGPYTSKDCRKNLLISAANAPHSIIKEHIGKEIDPSLLNYEATGPSVRSLDKSSGIETERQREITRGIIIVDQWPSQTHEWITRGRTNNWPSPVTIANIANMTWQAVPVGARGSINVESEWRLSFTLGERELVWRFNNTQIHVYYLLKTIVKTQISTVVPDIISSYHVKNLIFWISEENGINIWREENLLTCIEKCLKWLIRSVETKRLDHYFDKRRNLLHHKPLFGYNRLKIVKRLKACLDDIFTIVDSVNYEAQCPWYTSDMLANEPISDVFFLMNSIPKMFFKSLLKTNFASDQGYSLQSERERYLKKPFIQKRLNESSASLSMLSLYTFWILTLKNGLENLEQVPQSDIVRFAVAYTNILLSCVVQITDDKDMYPAFNIPKNNIILTALKKGCDLDGLSGSLYYAAYLYTGGAYSLCITKITEVLSSGKTLLYLGRGYRPHSLVCNGPGKVKILPHICTANKTVEDHSKLVTYDVDVNPISISILLHDVGQLEVSNFVWIWERQGHTMLGVHPLIFAYYLSVKCYMKLGKVAQAEESIVNLLDTFECLVGRHWLEIYSNIPNVYIAQRCIINCLDSKESEYTGKFLERFLSFWDWKTQVLDK